MSVKFKVITAGVVFLILAIFFYFTVRFKYVEADQIGSLARTTNNIIRDYHEMEKRMGGVNKTPSPDDLSAFLKHTHGTYKQVALMAITDKALSVRLSSKNDRYIRSADLFEAILKDFTQDKFNITRNNPYVIRYYDEKTAHGVEQIKFYIFINKLGGYRLLVVYPHTFGDTLLTRTALEIALITVCIIIAIAVVYITLTKKKTSEADVTAHTIDLNFAGSSASREDGAVARDTSSIVSDGLSGYVHDLFKKVNASFGTDGISLYIFHSSGKLIKTMELTGSTFLRIDSVSFDTIDIDNEAGRELRNGATMILEESRKIIIPLVYNNAFLGAVSIEKQKGLPGTEIRDIKNAMEGVLKNIHDYIIVNDVMTDVETGIHSKVFYNLKYHECMNSWKGRSRDFSLIFIKLFGKIEQIGDNEKNKIIKLLTSSITDIIKSDGFICRHDDLLAIIAPDMNSRKARGIAREIRNSLMKYRIKINDETVLHVEPSIGISSTDASGGGEDLAVLAMRQLDAAG